MSVGSRYTQYTIKVVPKPLLSAYVNEMCTFIFLPFDRFKN